MELDAKTWKGDLKTLKAWQQLYGRFQDLHVQIELLGQFQQAAPEVVPAVITGILQTLEDRKAGARKQILALGGLNAAPL